MAYTTAHVIDADSFANVWRHDRVADYCAYDLARDRRRTGEWGQFDGDAHRGRTLSCFTSGASNLTNDDTNDPEGLYERQDLFVCLMTVLRDDGAGVQGRLRNLRMAYQQPGLPVAGLPMMAI